MLQPTQTHCQRSASSGRAFPWAHLTLAVRRLNRQPQPLLLSVPQTELPMFYKPLHPQGLCKTGFCGPGSLGNIIQPVTFQVYKWSTQGPAKPCGRGLTGFASHVCQAFVTKEWFLRSYHCQPEVALLSSQPISSSCPPPQRYTHAQTRLLPPLLRPMPPITASPTPHHICVLTANRNTALGSTHRHV